MRVSFVGRMNLKRESSDRIQMSLQFQKIRFDNELRHLRCVSWSSNGGHWTRTVRVTRYRMEENGKGHTSYQFVLRFDLWVNDWVQLVCIRFVASSAAGCCYHLFCFRNAFFCSVLVAAALTHINGGKKTCNNKNTQLDRRSNSVGIILLTGCSSVPGKKIGQLINLLKSDMVFVYFAANGSEMHSIYEFRCFFSLKTQLRMV